MRFVATFVVFGRCLALLSARDTGVDPFVLQGFSEAIRVIAVILEQPVDLWHATEQCPYSEIITELSSGDKRVNRSSLAVADGMQLGVQVARFQRI
ncbi:hypothetical protein RSK20926_11104 [Roseobacter sp. SK209-2-6]|nr:hypothetical protein RSK20926_11104 [Roseobacter sp. SK209-2-6]